MAGSQTGPKTKAVQKVIVERVQVEPGDQAVPEGCWRSGGMRLSSTQRRRLGIVSYHKK